MVDKINTNVIIVMLGMLSITLSATLTTMLLLPKPYKEPSRLLELVAWNSTEDEPTYSFDGKYLAFISNKDGSFDVWFMRADGSRPTKLTSLPGNEYSLKWSPQEYKIAFLFTTSNGTGIGLVDLSGLLKIIVPAKATVQSFDWAPDGKRIVYASNEGGRWDIWIVDIFSGWRQKVTDDEAMDIDPTWSPDGYYIYFSSNRAGSFDIFKLEVSSKRLLQLTTSIIDEIRPVPSPDGKKLLFLARIDGENWYIKVMDNDGSNQRRMMEPYFFGKRFPYWEPVVPSACFPHWNKLQKILFYSSPIGLDYNVYVVTLNATIPPLHVADIEGEGPYMEEVVGSPANEYNPSWSPDGSRIAFVSDLRGNPDIWVMTYKESRIESVYG